MNADTIFRKNKINLLILMLTMPYSTQNITPF